MSHYFTLMFRIGGRPVFERNQEKEKKILNYNWDGPLSDRERIGYERFRIERVMSPSAVQTSSGEPWR